MANITVDEAQAWLEPSKLTIDALDEDLESQVVSEVLSRLATAFDTSEWSSATTTPKLVRTIIAMMYVSWFYNRQYSEDEPNSNEYALRLLAVAEANIVGLLNGTLLLLDVTTTIEVGGPASFYPNDLSSAMDVTVDDPSLGPAKFSMGTIW